MLKQTKYSIFSIALVFGLVGCGGGGSSGNYSADITKITKRNISGKTFNIEDVLNGSKFTTTFNADGTISGGDSKFSDLFEWDVSKVGELQTIFKVYGTTISITTHKQIGYENECYIVSSTETNSQWKGKYKICKLIKTPVSKSFQKLDEYSSEITIEGKAGTRVFVNGIDTDTIIDSNGQAQIIVDTNELKNNTIPIMLKDDKGNESNILNKI